MDQSHTSAFSEHTWSYEVFATAKQNGAFSLHFFCKPCMAPWLYIPISVFLNLQHCSDFKSEGVCSLCMYLLLLLTDHCWWCRHQNKVSGLSAKPQQSSIKQRRASEWTTPVNTCFFLFSRGAGCLSVVVRCHTIILFIIWIKVVLETALTFRPRCTWAAWGPSCGAAAGIGPDRCSAGTGLASAWTPEYHTVCQLVFGATVRQGEKKLTGITHSSLPYANLEKQTYCCCHERNLW